MPGSMERHMGTVSIEVNLQGMSCRAAAARRKEVSNGALWAMRTGLSPQKRRKSFTASSSPGASLTMASVMPVSSVILAGIGTPGLTKVL